MTAKERRFVQTVWKFYQRHGRRSLPWRRTTNPYRILVSETMLQQTQVERVIPKYKSFLKKFPDVKKLAVAKLSDVLKEWQGLGYNRRAKMLHDAAQIIMSEYGGRFSRTHDALQTLPGVGHYTARAVMVFAHNAPVTMIETNIRTVFLHHFYPHAQYVSDTELFRYIETTLDRTNPREWYAALMDYGTYLKQEHGNQNVRSKHYKKQSLFKGSEREVRGAVVRVLARRQCTFDTLVSETSAERNQLKEVLLKLVSEGMVMRRAGQYSLPE